MANREMRPLVPQGLPSELDGGQVDAGMMLAPEGADFATSAAGVPQRQVSPWSLLRYRWSIVFVFVLTAAIGVAGVKYLMVPTYTATAKIEVSPIIKQLVESKNEMVPAYESFRASQQAHITGTEVMQRVLDNADVRRTHWYRGTPIGLLEETLDRLGLHAVGPAKDRLIEATKVDLPRGTQHIFVSFTGKVPGEPYRIVDTIVDEYKRFADERDAAEDRKIAAARGSKIRELQGALETKQKSVSDMRAKVGAGDPVEVLTQMRLRIMDLESTRVELQTRLTALTGMATPATQPAGPRFDRDERWLSLREGVRQAEFALSDASDRFGEDHHERRRTHAALERAREALQMREQELATQPAAPGSGGMTEVERLQLELKVTEDKVARATEECATLDQNSKAWSELQREIQSIESALEELRRTEEAKQMNSEVAGIIKTFEPQEPAAPDSSKKTKLMLAAPFGALAFALGLAYLRAKLSKTVNAAEEVVGPTRAAFLGHIPWQPGLDAAALQASPMQVECVRMVRTAILQRLGPGSHVVQVTSAEPASGKSTLSLMLGRSLAQCGKRVLLVDADVLRPSLADTLEIPNAPGLMDVLSDRPVEQGGVRTTSVERLSVLTAGDIQHPDDLELLANGVFSSLIERFRAGYDFVLLDSSPLLGTANGAILSRQVDGTVLAVRERHCRRTALVAALAALSAAGGRLLGTVFVGTSALSAYGYAPVAYHYDRRLPAAPAEESESVSS